MSELTAHVLSEGFAKEEPFSVPNNPLLRVAVNKLEDFLELAEDAAPNLWTEVRILERLLYRNNNQHRNAPFFHHTKLVCKKLRPLRSLRLIDTLQKFRRLFVVGGSATQRLSTNKVSVPSQWPVTLMLKKLLAFSAIHPEVVSAIAKASKSLMQLISQTYFMAFSVSCLGCVGRIRSHLDDLAAAAADFYQILYKLVPDLPEPKTPPPDYSGLSGLPSRVSEFSPHKKCETNKIAAPVMEISIDEVEEIGEVVSREELQNLLKKSKASSADSDGFTKPTNDKKGSGSEVTTPTASTNFSAPFGLRSPLRSPSPRLRVNSPRFVPLDGMPLKVRAPSSSRSPSPRALTDTGGDKWSLSAAEKRP